MASKSTKAENLSGVFGDQPTGWSKFVSLVSDPELMQPTILALSVTYILVTASIYLQLLAPMPHAIMFTYYCCILGLISCIVFYLRLLYNDESSQGTVRTVHVLLQCALVGLYIGHWFVPFADSSPRDTKWAVVPDKPVVVEMQQLYEPQHMVVKIVFIICVVISLISSLVR